MNQRCSRRASIQSIITHLILLLALSVLLPAQHADAQSLRLLVPAYFYPGGGSLAYWNELDAAASLVPTDVIFNPDSGPGPSADPNYMQALTNLRAAGGQTLAYIYTDYGNTPLATVEGEISTYLQQYPNLESGFFLDGMSNAPAEVSYYNALYTYIKSLNSGLDVFGNPGANTPEVYLTAPAADTLVTFENSAVNYPTSQPLPYALTLSNSDFASLIYDQPTVAGMQSDVAQALADNVGYIYVTDGSLPNPYDALPSYWDQEVATIQAADVPEPSSLAMTAGLLGLSVIALLRYRRSVRAREILK